MSKCKCDEMNLQVRERERGRRSRASGPARCIAAGLVVAGALLMSVPSEAGEGVSANVQPAVLRGVGIDQKLNQQVPLDLMFRDETGKAVRLGDYFGQKPVVLALVYYDCPMLCTLVLNGMLNSMKAIEFDIGKQYQVVTVSFDPTEKPPLANAKKAVYAGLYGRPGVREGWHFLTGDEPSIRALADSVGFRYRYDEQSKQFVHATAIMVLTPEGKISRYLYGISYPPGTLRLSLVEASQRKIGTPVVDAILLYCCQYDPQTGKYSVVISHILKIGAGVTVLMIALLIFMLSRAGRRVSHAPSS